MANIIRMYPLSAFVSRFHIGQHGRSQINDMDIVAVIERQQPPGILPQDVVVVGIDTNIPELARIFLGFHFSLCI